MDFLLIFGADPCILDGMVDVLQATCLRCKRWLFRWRSVSVRGCRLRRFVRVVGPFVDPVSSAALQAKNGQEPRAVKLHEKGPMRFHASALG